MLVLVLVLVLVQEQEQELVFGHKLPLVVPAVLLSSLKISVFSIFAPF